MNDELSLAYLLNPTFELVNTNGKPLTDGYIEVYIAGSREKYYCYSDFDGTLHPFKIPLDSLGSNIVLAELDKSYDIYIYNRFGNLVMSRYNVVPVGSGSGSSNPNITISSNDETVQVENVSAGNFDLSISNTVDRVTALEEAVANIVSDSTAAYSIAHSNTTNNGTFNLTNDGVSGVEYLSDMTGWRLQSGHIYQMNFNAKLVSDVDRDRYIEGKLYLEGIDTVAQEWQFTLDDSYDHTESVNGSTVLYIPSNLPYYDVRLKYDSLVAPTLNKISIVDITKIIEEQQVVGHTYTGVSGVIVDNTNDLILADMDFINSQLNVEAQIASGIQIANEYTDNVVNNVSGDLIQVINEVSSNIPTDYVTHNEVSGVSGNLVNTISSVSSTLQNEIENIDLTEYATHSEVNTVSGVLENEIQTVSGAIPTDYVTHNEVSGVSGNLVNYVNNVSGNLVDIIETATGNIPEQVNADWNAVSGKAEILNKPDLSIYATNEDLQIVSAAIPDVSEFATRTEVNTVSGVLKNDIKIVRYQLENEIQTVSGAIPDISNLATKDELNIVSGMIPTDVVTHNEVSAVSGNLVNYVDSASGNLVNLINEVSGNIPEQVQSDWTESDIDSPAYIKHKPDLDVYATKTELVSGLNVVSGMIPDVSDFVTENELETVSGTIVNMIPVVTGYATTQALESVSGSLQNEIETVSGMIPDVSDFATHSELASVSSTLQNEIDSIPEQVNADWDAVSGKAEILNKPEESSLLAGDGIAITTSGSDYVISSNAHTYTAGNYISIQNDVISVNGISPQVNSDWKAVAGVQAILNKPDESTLLAGDGISIAASGTDFVISSTVSAEPQVVTGINKTYYQGLDETFVSKINGYKIQAKVDQYGNVINTTYATKSQVNDLSNRVDAVSAAVSGQIPNIEITSPSGTLVINSSVSGNTKTYSIDVAPSASANGFEYGTFHATNNVTYDATMAKVKGNIDVTNDGKIKLKQGQSYHITVRGAYNQTTPSDSTSTISYVEYISFDSIALNIDRSVTYSQFFELSYDLFNLASNVDYRILFTGLSGYINELYIDIHSISNSNTVTPVTGGTEYTAGYGIEILNNVISVSGIQPQVNSDWNSNSGKSQILNKPDLSVYATNNDLQVVSAAIPTVTPQVNSDWKAVSGVAQILNKPAESTLIAGDGISIAASGDDFVISSTVTGGGGSGVTYTAGDYIDITDNTISVTGITDLVAGNSITITASGASAIISSTGEAQVQSDWDEMDSNSKAYIRNKPSIPQSPEQADWLQSDPWSLSYIKNKPTIPNQGASGVTVSGSTISLYQPLGFVAGDNISITVSGDSAVISSDVTVTGYATEIEVENVSSTLQTEINNVSASIVPQVNSDWDAVSGVAQILNKPNQISLVAGSGISIIEDNNTLTISASATAPTGGADSNIFFIEATERNGRYNVTSDISDVGNALSNNKVMALRITGTNSAKNNVITNITSYEYYSQDDLARIQFTQLKGGKEYRYMYLYLGDEQDLDVQESTINQDYNTTNTITVNNSNHTLKANAATVLTTASSGMTFNNANFEISPTSGLLKLDITTVTNNVTGTFDDDYTTFNVSNLPINNIYYFSDVRYWGNTRVEFYNSSDERVYRDTIEVVDGVYNIDFTQILGETSWGEITYITISYPAQVTLSYDASTVVKIPYIAVPSAPATGNYVLKCIDGEIQWALNTLGG